MAPTVVSRSQKGPGLSLTTLPGVALVAYPRRCGLFQDAIGRYQAQDSVFDMCQW